MLSQPIESSATRRTCGRHDQAAVGLTAVATAVAALAHHGSSSSSSTAEILGAADSGLVSASERVGRQQVFLFCQDVCCAFNTTLCGTVRQDSGGG